MALYFSQSANNFLDDQITSIPEDAVEITIEEFNVLLSERTLGKIVQADENGRPMAVLPPAPTVTEIRTGMKCKTWQFKRALTQLDLRDAVETAIASADQDTKDMWFHATEFERLNPMLVSMGVLLNKTPAELDSIFELAVTIV